MPRLKVIKQEQFVQAIPNSPSLTKAYQNTYHCEYDTAKNNASRLLSKPAVSNRLLEVFQEKNMTDDWIADGLRMLAIEDPKGSVRLGALRTVLEVRKDIDSSAKIGIQVNIDQEKKENALSRLERYKSIINR